MPEKVQCSKCGFLALRETVTRGLVEVERETRETGEIIPKHYRRPHATGIRQCDPEPICFVMADDIFAEYVERRPNRSASETMSSVIEAHRECVRFTKWRQGHSPKDHYEMLAERERLEWQANQARESREFLATQAELSDGRYAEQLRIADERHKEQMDANERRERNTWIRAFVIAILAALLGYGISWLPTRGPSSSGAQPAADGPEQP